MAISDELYAKMENLLKRLAGYDEFKFTPEDAELLGFTLGEVVISCKTCKKRAGCRLGTEHPNWLNEFPKFANLCEMLEGIGESVTKGDKTVGKRRWKQDIMDHPSSSRLPGSFRSKG